MFKMIGLMVNYFCPSSLCHMNLGNLLSGASFAQYHSLTKSIGMTFFLPFVAGWVSCCCVWAPEWSSGQRVCVCSLSLWEPIKSLPSGTQPRLPGNKLTQQEIDLGIPSLCRVKESIQ